jgi:hypothetical protein
VRAHNWAVMGDLLLGHPWTFPPHEARLCCRQSQLPAGETFRTKTALAVELLGQADAAWAALILAVFDGAYAVETVIRPWLSPQADRRQIEIVTRLRGEARLYRPLVVRTPRKGRPPVWGPRLAAP